MTVISKFTRAARAGAALIAASGMALPVTAQTVNDSDTPAASLDLPSNLQIFGKVDPNLRKPTAIVNDVVITGTDVDQRVAMIVALNRLQLTAQEKDELRLSVLRQLIDETLQIQEAKSNEIKVTDEQVEQTFNNVARKYARSTAEFTTMLRQAGSSERSIRRQIEGELAWSRLLQKQVEWRINVSDEEIKSILDNMEKAKGTEEYNLKEIFVSSTPIYGANCDPRKMMQQMQAGTAPFEYFARTCSEASTRAREGDLGWVRISTLPSELAGAVQQMKIGQVAGPIEVAGGYSILVLADKRQVLTADPRDARLSVRQLTITFPAGTTQAQATNRASEFAKETAALRGCGDVPKLAQKLDAKVVDNDQIVIRQLPPQLQEMILPLQLGQATPPFGSVEDGIRVLVLCGRDDAREASLPSREQLRNQIEQQRVNLRAQRMLRDLRRDALVEYR